MDINIPKGRNGGISLLSKKFQIAELKLLVDAVQSSRFITQKKSFDIIKKLGELASTHEREELQREVYIINRINLRSIDYSTNKTTQMSSLWWKSCCTYCNKRYKRR